MKKLLIFIILFFIVLSGCQGNYKIQAINSSRNIVMIMVDSMTAELLEESLKTDDFPALRFLIENGQVYNNLVAPFPSMSVSIEASLITGDMPNVHNVPGLTWYDRTEDRIVDYGTSFETIRKLGMKQSIDDAMDNLNNTHLNKESSTIFEELQSRGISTGAINLLLYRGNKKNELEIPGIIHTTTKAPEVIETKTPDVFAFGSFHRPEQLENELLIDALIFRAGFTDNYATQVITKLMETNQQPRFLLAFFPEMDKKTHRKGPNYVRGFKEVDEHLQRILNVYDDWNLALENNTFILFGDHGQDQLVEDEEATKISLEELYPYKIASFEDKPSNGEIVIANNHRMAFVYPIKKEITTEELAHKALQDERIAIAATKINNWIRVWSPDSDEYFEFKKNGEWKDQYNQSWSIRGNFDVLKLQVDETDKTVDFSDYPDALNQLYSATLSQENSTIITAKPGHIIYSETAPVHNGGGEHGGLHRNDTLAALVIAGSDKTIQNPRIVDLKDYILSLLEVEKAS